MFTVNHEQFFIQMTQTCKHSKCLQILAGEDFQLNSSGERWLKFIGVRIEDNREAENIA